MIKSNKNTKQQRFHFTINIYNRMQKQITTGSKLTFYSLSRVKTNKALPYQRSLNHNFWYAYFSWALTMTCSWTSLTYDILNKHFFSGNQKKLVSEKNTSWNSQKKKKTLKRRVCLCTVWFLKFTVSWQCVLGMLGGGIKGKQWQFNTGCANVMSEAAKHE